MFCINLVVKTKLQMFVNKILYYWIRNHVYESMLVGFFQVEGWNTFQWREVII